jgi:2-alkyl-3-oxoalkanoate reductase
MRVFVAGATGAIGRPLLPKLVAAGHQVIGMTRSAERAAWVREAGAEPLVCDVFEEDALREAMAATRPDVVVHQLTALPHRFDFRDESLYNATNLLRGEGTRILLSAAVAARARRMIVQSISFVVEDPPPDPGSGFGEASATVLEMERLVTSSTELEGLALRYGLFYGPGTSYCEGGSTTAEVRRRRFPVVGRGEGVFSFIHVDDAADATVAAVKRGAPGIYDVVDDEPAPLREWLPVFAAAMGARKPMRVPALLARMVAGRQAIGFLARMEGASNGAAKAELGWQPRWKSWRQGFAEAPR